MSNRNRVFGILEEMVDCKEIKEQQSLRNDELCEQLHAFIEGNLAKGDVFLMGQYVIRVDRAFSTPKHRYKVSRAVELPVVEERVMAPVASV